MPKLSDTKIRAAKPRTRPYKLYDLDGVFLVITSNGSKWWRQRYRYAGKEQLLSLGIYDQVSLSDAREKGAAVRKLVAKGQDPSAERKTQKAALIETKANSFKAVALTWHAKFKPTWDAHHARVILQRLNDNVFPWIGGKPIREVTSADVLACIDRMAERGAYETARRVLQLVKRIFKWAIGRGFVTASPAAHVEPKEQLPSKKVKHRASIKDAATLSALLRAIELYPGGFIVKYALKLLALTFVRPAEVRYAEWHEFDLTSKEPTWRIPAAKMKMEGEP